MCKVNEHSTDTTLAANMCDIELVSDYCEDDEYDGNQKGSVPLRRGAV